MERLCAGSHWQGASSRLHWCDASLSNSLLVFIIFFSCSLFLLCSAHSALAAENHRLSSIVAKNVETPNTSPFEAHTLLAAALQADKKERMSVVKVIDIGVFEVDRSGTPEVLDVVQVVYGLAFGRGGGP